MNSIKTKNNFYPNTCFTFDGLGMVVEVSLNITPNLKPYLSVNNVFKGEKMWVYRVKKHIDSININKKTVEATHEHLLNNCMINIRRAKVSALNKQILTLQRKNDNFQ